MSVMVPVLYMKVFLINMDWRGTYFSHWDRINVKLIWLQKHLADHSLLSIFHSVLELFEDCVCVREREWERECVRKCVCVCTQYDFVLLCSNDHHWVIASVM